jgi:hypothetical protein
METAKEVWLEEGLLVGFFHKKIRLAAQTKCPK